PCDGIFIASRDRRFRAPSEKDREGGAFRRGEGGLRDGAPTAVLTQSAPCQVSAILALFFVTEVGVVDGVITARSQLVPRAGRQLVAIPFSSVETFRERRPTGARHSLEHDRSRRRRAVPLLAMAFEGSQVETLVHLASELRLHEVSVGIVAISSGREHASYG